MPRLFDLGGSVALVTGATGGLGAALCHALAEHGARVILSDQDAAACAGAAAAMCELGFEARGLACDLRSPAALEGFVSQALGIWGRIDTLVCNAGVQGPAGP